MKHDIPKKHIKIHLLGDSSRDIKITDCLETYLLKVLAVKHDISKNHVKIHVLRVPFIEEGGRVVRVF